MKYKFLLFFFYNILFYSPAYSKPIIKDSVNKLNKMILTISYPEKISYFQIKKNNNNENELYLVINDQIRKSRKISPKDLVWLEKRFSKFIFDSRTPNSKCQLGEVSLSVQYFSKAKSLKRCLGAQDKMTKKLLTLTQTLRTFL